MRTNEFAKTSLSTGVVSSQDSLAEMFETITQQSLLDTKSEEASILSLIYAALQAIK